MSVLCPGAVRTPILTGGKYGRTKGIDDKEMLEFWESMRPMAPEEFAERALRAVLRGDAIIVIPAWWKALWYLNRMSPALAIRVVGRARSATHLRVVHSRRRRSQPSPRRGAFP